MSGEEKSCGTKDCKIVIMEKEPIFKKRRVCEPSAAGTGASTSGTSSVAWGAIDACDFESSAQGILGGQKQLR